MKEFEDLTELERRILVRFCQANNYSLSSHVPKQAVNLNVKGVHPKHIKRAVKLLLSNGFVLIKPTGRQTTYKLSNKGLKAGNLLKNNE